MLDNNRGGEGRGGEGEGQRAFESNDMCVVHQSMPFRARL